jgi:hypothetical protein
MEGLWRFADATVVKQSQRKTEALSVDTQVRADVFGSKSFQLLG